MNVLKPLQVSPHNKGRRSADALQLGGSDKLSATVAAYRAFAAAVAELGRSA